MPTRLKALRSGISSQRSTTITLSLWCLLVESLWEDAITSSPRTERSSTYDTCIDDHPTKRHFQACLGGFCDAVLPPIRIFPPKHRIQVYICLPHNQIQIQMKGSRDQGKVYREFSRQMFNRMKHQFPRKRESQIVSEVIKKWNSLSQNQKKVLSDKYELERTRFYEENEETDPKIRYQARRQESFKNKQGKKKGKAAKNKPINKSKKGKECFKNNLAMDMTPEKVERSSIELTAQKKQTQQKKQ